MIAVKLLLLAISAAICGCALVVVALNVAIIGDFLKTLGSRSWRLACGIVLISALAGVLWTEFQNALLAKIFAITILSIVPVIKFSICWHRNAMPQNRHYATALKMSFLPCCLLVVFGALILCDSVISPKSINTGTNWAHATIP